MHFTVLFGHYMISELVQKKLKTVRILFSILFSII